MKSNRTPNRRAFAALIPATLLLAAPGLAQEVPTAAPPPATQTVAPPPVVPTLPPETITAAPSAAAPSVTPVDESPAARAPARTVRTAHAAARPVRATRTPVPAEVAPAPAAVTPAPAEVTPAPVTPAPVEAAAPAPAPAATTEATTTTESAPLWPWLVGLLVVLGAIGLFMMRRRRPLVDEEYHDQRVYEEPVVADAYVAPPAPLAAEGPAFAPAAAPQFLRTAPLAAASDAPAPLANEDAALATPEAEEVAGLTAGDAPVADRPWLEFALRPVRAGVSADEALVEFELTVGNAGSVKAKDVRISTFMFAAEPGTSAEMDQMLIDRGADGVPPITIEPGEGTRIDATLALPKADLIESTNGAILPVVVADARYTLADGSEGRTSASFTIGVSEEGTPAMSPISLGARGMHDEVEARLYGVPEHA
ncbi:hypothetical protein GCM10009087_24840 [Sphingomonas oligophenolica]|uniref:LPXTG cell wall anchor domain-containing protein n=1 Tax=Sphingomonas oligophenolica TaxID=301154 RepID=A0ABU9Y9P0_9SPHN